MHTLISETVVIAVIFQETPVTAAKFLRNAGNRRYFCTKYWQFRVSFPPIRRYRRIVLGQNSTREFK